MNRTGSNNLAVPQHQHVSHSRGNLVEVVGDEDQRRRSRIGRQLGQGENELLAAAKVETGARFVEQERPPARSSACGQAARAAVRPTTVVAKARSASQATPIRSRQASALASSAAS